MLTKEQRKHRLDVYAGDAPVYNVVSSDNSQKLTLKLSRTKDEPRGMCLMRLCCLHVIVISDKPCHKSSVALTSKTKR